MTAPNFNRCRQCGRFHAQGPYCTSVALPVEGYGASFDRESKHWNLYSMPDGLPIGVWATDRSACDLILAALRSAIEPATRAAAGYEVRNDFFKALAAHRAASKGERDEIIEACAIAAEAQDRVGREWVRDSLWDNIMKRAGANVRALKDLPQR